MPENSGGVRRRMAPADRARQLLRSAEEVFAECGFHSATMDDIARYAGVTRTVLYQHYSSKDDLAAASLSGTKAGHQAESIRRDMESLVGDLLQELGYAKANPHTVIHARAIVGAAERVAETSATTALDDRSTPGRSPPLPSGRTT